MTAALVLLTAAVLIHLTGRWMEAADRGVRRAYREAGVDFDSHAETAMAVGNGPGLYDQIAARMAADVDAEWEALNRGGVS